MIHVTSLQTSLLLPEELNAMICGEMIGEQRTCDINGHFGVLVLE